MKCVLAAAASCTGKPKENKSRMIRIMEKYSGKADLILFGEAGAYVK